MRLHSRFRPMLHALVVSVLSANLIATAPVSSHSAAELFAATTTPISLVDSIVVAKRAHTLTLYRDGKPTHTYLVALGGAPVGDKLRAGDHRTPEGLFYIDARQPNSKYHLALHISYPDASHRARPQALGAEPGGDIMIHGLPNGFGAAAASHRPNDSPNAHAA